jgi:hypothetical protein
VEGISHPMHALRLLLDGRWLDASTEGAVCDVKFGVC